MPVKLINTVLYCGQGFLEATVDDVSGHRRRVKVTWATRDKTDIPPKDWLEMVEKEVQFQIDSEKVGPRTVEALMDDFKKNG